MEEKNRKILFWALCVPSRIALALVIGLLLKHSRALSIVGAVLLLLVSLSFLSFVVGFRRRETGFFQGKAYWAPVRPIHALMYLFASILCFVGGEATSYAGVVLGADVAVGISTWLINYDVRIDKPPVEV